MVEGKMGKQMKADKSCKLKTLGEEKESQGIFQYNK